MVWFSLRVREVPGSIPGAALFVICFFVSVSLVQCRLQPWCSAHMVHTNGRPTHADCSWPLWQFTRSWPPAHRLHSWHPVHVQCTADHPAHVAGTTAFRLCRMRCSRPLHPCTTHHPTWWTSSWPPYQLVRAASYPACALLSDYHSERDPPTQQRERERERERKAKTWKGKETERGEDR